MDDILFVYTTWPDLETAESMAAEALAERLAACVNILAPMRSIYRWEGAVHTAAEIPMVLKTTATSAPALRDVIEARHPYATPCILALKVEQNPSSRSFLDWIRAETAAPSPSDD